MIANLRIAFFVALSITLMAIDSHYSHLKLIRSGLSALVYPLQYTVSMPIEFAEWATRSLTLREQLLEENNRLKQEHLLISSKLQRFEALENENNRLRDLLESSLQLDDKVLIAELVAVDSQVFRQQIVINKGSIDGAYEGQPVVGSSGIMGQVIQVTPFSSTVLLVTDTNHALPVQVDRNGLRAIAVGSGRNHQLFLKNLPNNSDIHVDDLIVSSGLGRRFPSGYPVGKVVEIIKKQSEPFARVVIQPSAQLNKSREVLMVWPNQKYTRKNTQQVQNMALR